MSFKKHIYNIGEIYNLMKLIELYKGNNNKTYAKCICIKCQKIKHMRACDLFNNKVNSCMCQNRKHGLTNHPLYSVYYNILDRCYNPNCQAYKNYGNKGINICDNWKDKENGFIIFYDWAVNNGYKKGLTIDRINVRTGYNPQNCRWITLSENVARANRDNVRRKNKNKLKYYGVSPDNNYYEFDNASQFAREQNLHSGCIIACANLTKKTHHKWKFGFIQNNNKTSND